MVAFYCFLNRFINLELKYQVPHLLRAERIASGSGWGWDSCLCLGYDTFSEQDPGSSNPKCALALAGSYWGYLDDLSRISFKFSRCWINCHALIPYTAGACWWAHPPWTQYHGQSESQLILWMACRGYSALSEVCSLHGWGHICWCCHYCSCSPSGEEKPDCSFGRSHYQNFGADSCSQLCYWKWTHTCPLAGIVNSSSTWDTGGWRDKCGHHPSNSSCSDSTPIIIATILIWCAGWYYQLYFNFHPQHFIINSLWNAPLGWHMSSKGTHYWPCSMVEQVERHRIRNPLISSLFQPDQGSILNAVLDSFAYLIYLNLQSMSYFSNMAAKYHKFLSIALSTYQSVHLRSIHHLRQLRVSLDTLWVFDHS